MPERARQKPGTRPATITIHYNGDVTWQAAWICVSCHQKNSAAVLALAWLNGPVSG
jgi:hypothetical protein